jgi:iron(III) transport system ATP-binding protein
MVQHAQTPTVRIAGLWAGYGSEQVLRGIDLEVAEGELLAVLGPSGCGKTTLLRVVAGLEAPTSGTVAIAGRLVAGGDTWVPPEHRHVGLVFQDGTLFPHLTVERNVRFGLRGRPDRDAVVRECLERVGLWEKRGRFPDELSGGEQQRVALARAIAPAPSVILLDEPFASLDAGLRQELREELRQVLAAARVTAILVTHDQEEALSLADRVAVMREGRLLQVGTPEAIYYEPHSEAVARFIGDGQLLDLDRIRPASQGHEPLPPGTGFSPLAVVHPEFLELAAAGSEHDAETWSGTLSRRRFYGHDRIEEVRLDTGQTVKVRLTAEEPLPLGSRVAVRLRRAPTRVF